MRPQFKDATSWADWYVETYNSQIGSDDLVFILGDLAHNQYYYDKYIPKLNGKKVLVLGNHDLNLFMENCINHFEEVAGIIYWGGYVFSHCPIHPSELRGCHNIHGHTHKSLVRDDRYINSCVDYNQNVLKLRKRNRTKKRSRMNGESSTGRKL